MFCAHCGQPVAPDARFCGACGAEVIRDGQPNPVAGGDSVQAAESAPATTGESAPRVLLRFGPMGIRITSKRPSLFTVSRQNCTEVIADTRCLWGIRKMPKVALGVSRKQGQVVFQIPYDRIVSVTRADFLANKALWILYQENGGEKGVGIEAALLHHRHVLDLEKLLQNRMTERPGG